MNPFYCIQLILHSIIHQALHVQYVQSVAHENCVIIQYIELMLP